MSFLKKIRIYNRIIMHQTIVHNNRAITTIMQKYDYFKSKFLLKV